MNYNAYSLEFQTNESLQACWITCKDKKAIRMNLSDPELAMIAHMTRRRKLGLMAESKSLLSDVQENLSEIEFSL